MPGSLAPTLEYGTAQALAELSRTAGTDWDRWIRRALQFDAEVLHVECVSFWGLCEETSSIHCDAAYVASAQALEHGATLFEAHLLEFFGALREARVLDVFRIREGAPEILAIKHHDPRKQDALLEAYQSGRWRFHLARRVISQGQSVLLPELTPSVLARYGYDPSDHVLTERLGLRSLIGVPLAVGDKTFGAMVFAGGDRLYDGDDLALAEDIASRVAAALENARLYAVAREAIRARDELLVVAAHELRTPLTALRLRTDQLLRKARRGADPGERASSEGIARDVRRFTGVVDHILDALKIRGEGVALACAPCDLAAIVRERVDLVAERARLAASPIALDSEPSIADRWDRARLEKVIDVLLDNAIKFGSGRPIAVSLRASEKWAELTVRDRGIGIPADRLPAIFRPFERAVPKEHFGGLGLGLFVAMAIVDAHGGSIEVTSRPGEGATFIVRLPLAGQGEPGAIR